MHFRKWMEQRTKFHNTDLAVTTIFGAVVRYIKSVQLGSSESKVVRWLGIGELRSLLNHKLKEKGMKVKLQLYT